MSAYLKSAIYGGDSLSEIYQLPLFFGFLSLLIQLPFSIRKDIKRRKQMRYGRRLKGTERLTPKEFNCKVQGEGIGIKIDGLKEMLRIPAKAEAQHVQIIADTGGGKTTIIMQMLRQIRSRGDSAIVYDPALEYTRRFYDPKRDIILNPLDRRCPYWGPAEELRRSSEADAIAVSLFQPPQDKKGEFFFEIPQQIFAHLLRYGPTPEELIEWMSNPEEIDNRVARHRGGQLHRPHGAPSNELACLASLSKVAKSLRLLPHKGAGNGEWTATEWSETRQGWIFITSLPAEREALRPLQSVWIDMLVLRLLNEPKAHQKRVWFVLDELASLQRLPQFHTALTENRKSNNPIIMGFQGKAQLEVIYGHLAEVMLSQPTTSIFLKTKEPKAGEWVSKAIGKVEIERMKETHFDGTRSGRNFALDIQIEPVVMESEISGLARPARLPQIRELRHGFLVSLPRYRGTSDSIRAQTFAGREADLRSQEHKGAKPATAPPRRRPLCQQRLAQPLILRQSRSKKQTPRRLRRIASLPPLGLRPTPERTPARRPPTTSSTPSSRHKRPWTLLRIKRRICSPSQNRSAPPRRRPTTPKSSRLPSKTIGSKTAPSSASGRASWPSDSALPERLTRSTLLG